MCGVQQNLFVSKTSRIKMGEERWMDDIEFNDNECKMQEVL